ncbi:MAG: large-conductance mechanosensitive channel protein MscL [Firmicutes bacterium]|nr:large-conductance mechanosensitive channel protein MscL [Bacillota bacterium]
MWEDFKTFALKGNVLDMAVGVIVGGAFGKIVTSLVNDIIMPFLGLIVGRIDLTSLKLVLRHANETTSELSITYGAFLQNVLDFLIISFSIFLAVRLINNLRKKEEDAPPKPAAPPAPSAEEKLLTEIRDLLRDQNTGRTA